MRFSNQTFILIFLSILTSCVYYPQLTDIPLINEKGDLRIDGGISSNISTNGTISYGLTNNIALQVYGNFTNDYYYHGAIGYYKNFGDRNVFEFYSGIGNGIANAYRDATGGHLKGNYRNYFTQLNIGKINSSLLNVDMGIGLRTGLLHSNLVDYNYYDYKSDIVTNNTYIDNSFLLEPMLFIRFGGEHFKVNLKLGNCELFKFTHKDKRIPYGRFSLGLSLNYNF